MIHLARPISLPLLLVAAASAQESQLPPRLLEIGAAPRTEVAFNHYADGSIWARGRTYKASVDAGGFTYVPFLGSGASRNWPIGFELVEATVGGEALDICATEPVRAGHRFALDRGAAVVRYDLALESVEQSFLIEGAAGAAADLVLRVAIHTELEVSDTGVGFRFTGPDGSAELGATTVLDGVGHRLVIDPTLEDGQICFRVPAEFLAAAEGDVVVDPLITTLTVDDFGGELTDPDVAFEEDGEAYCVVYEEVFSMGDTDIYARTFDATTFALLDEGYVHNTSLESITPKVASLAQNDSFLVVYRLDDTFGRPEIYARKRDSMAGAAWQSERLVASYDEFFYRLNHDVGGESYEDPGETNYLVVWEKQDRSGGAFPSSIEARLVDGDGLPQGVFIDVTPGLANSNRWPSVSKSSGDPNLHGGWWVAYSSQTPTAPISTGVRGARISFNGTITDADAQIVQTASPSTIAIVDVSPPYESAYGETAHLTFNYVPSGGIFARTVAFARNVGGSLIVVEGLLDEIDVSGPQRSFAGIHAAIADRVVHFHITRDTAAGVDTLLASTQELVLGVGIAIGERRSEVTAVTSGMPSNVDATSRHAGGDWTSHRVFAVWNAESASGDMNVYGALMAFPEPAAIGGNVCRGFPNSTGDYGYLTAFGDNSTTGPKSLRATNLPPGALGYFLAAPMGGWLVPAGSDGVLCVGGSIGRYAGSVLNSGSAGRFDFVVDPTSIAQPTGSVSAMAGDRWFFQAWHRDANPAPTSNFTNAIMIGF